MRSALPIKDLKLLSELVSPALSSGTALFRSLSDSFASRVTAAQALYLYDTPLDVSRLYDITSGGLRKNSETSASLFEWIAEITSAYLAQHGASVCVVENRSARRTDKSLARFQVKPVFFGEEVYHLYDKTTKDLSEVVDTLKKASMLPHFGIALADARIADQVDEAYIRTVVLSCRRLFLFAYDGEGFLDISLRAA